MKKTRNHLFLWLLLAALPLPGQGQERETLRFSRPEWNFGDIREEEGKVTHTFVGRNEGDEPLLVIVEVTATCGCTVPSFSLPNPSCRARRRPSPSRSTPATGRGASPKSSRSFRRDESGWRDSA